MPPKGKNKGGNVANSATPDHSEAAIDNLLKSVFGKKDQARSDVALSDPKSILETLVPALTYLCDKVNRLEKLLGEQGDGGEGDEEGGRDTSSSSLHHRIRIQEDELDEARQRSLKGNLILTSSTKGGRPCLIKDDATLQREKTRLVDHAIQLVKDKYGVTVPEDDVVACHRLKQHSVLLKIWRRTEDSAWSRLMPLIKSAPTNDLNIYVNFQLTPRRGAMMYAIRQQREDFKSKGRPFKLFSDENGSISIQFFNKDRKEKLTFHRVKGSVSKTFTQKEISDMFNAHK
jgi:hypothetical protein